MQRATLTRKDIAEQVRQYIVTSFLEPRQDTLQNDDDLLTVLNSLQLLRMVMELETRFQVSIDNSELAAENLGTVERIAEFITGKLFSAEG